MKIQQVLFVLAFISIVNCLKNSLKKKNRSQQVNIEGLMKLKNIQRSIDGSNNNLNNPNWGKSYTPVKRTTPPRYQDSIGEMLYNLPNPRFLSQSIAKLPGNRVFPNKQNLTMLFGTWGQFLDHDITFTQQGNLTKLYCEVPRCDQIFDVNCTGTQKIFYNRSQFDPNIPIRTQINRVTAWIDASMVYGSTQLMNKAIRAFKDGKLNTTDGDMLPINQTGNFHAGDKRVNSNLGLTSLHVVFLRQHNRLCDLILKQNPNLTDEEVFNTSRNYVIGLIQKITMYDFLPLLFGQQHWQRLIGQYQGYNSSLDPTIKIEFSTAAYRIGHPYIPRIYKAVDDVGNVEKLNLLQIFLAKPKSLPRDRVKTILKGLAFTLCKQRDLKYIDQLRDVILTFRSIQGRVIVRNFDLFVFNTVRIRDHGVADYNSLRAAFGLKKYESFEQIFKNQKDRVIIQQSYNSINNIDANIGILGQQKLQNSFFGETSATIAGIQFKNIRDGDRFWFESAYPPEVISQIKRTTLEDIIKRNTDIKNMPKNGFHCHNCTID